ncbi:MAG: DUF6133 family protein [Acutalibacteraceae bacterium]
MKKIKTFIENLRNKAVATVCDAKAAVETAAQTKDGEFFIDKGVAIIIVLAVGVIVLGLLLTAWKDTIMPNIGTKITEMFAAS